MLAFWEALLKAVLAGNALRLPEGTFFMGKKAMGSALFVRPRVHRQLFEEMKRQVGNGNPRMVLTGTAGTGKTFFLPYLLWALATSEDPPPCIIFEREVRKISGLLVACTHTAIG